MAESISGRIGKAEEKKLELALERYRNNKATASKAAEIAGLPLSKFFDVLHKRKIEFHYTLEDFKEDIKEVL